MIKKILLAIGLISTPAMADHALTAGTFAAGNAAVSRGDYAEAAKHWRVCADEGDMGCQELLGILYEGGFGVDQDYTEAAKWYRLSAEQGNPIAQLNLGSMYFKGKGVAQDYTRL